MDGIGYTFGRDTVDLFCASLRDAYSFVGDCDLQVLELYTDLTKSMSCFQNIPSVLC